jgi:predicted amidohydrolase
LDNAVTVPGETIERLCSVARECGVQVVMGINERDVRFSGGTLYNSLVYISASGAIAGVHRKLLPTHAERMIWGQGDGSTLTVVDTELGRLGGLICWEHWMPLARFAMHAKAEQVHVAAWPEVPEMHHVASRHYAFEGRCFVICVGSYLAMSDVPDDFELAEAMLAAGDFGQMADVILPGGSGIIGPDGAWIAGPMSGQEGIVYGEVSLERIGEEQQALDVVGHYNRPDVFGFRVDERPQTHAEWLREDPAGSSTTPRLWAESIQETTSAMHVDPQLVQRNGEHFKGREARPFVARERRSPHDRISGSRQQSPGQDA